MERKNNKWKDIFQVVGLLSGIASIIALFVALYSPASGESTIIDNRRYTNDSNTAKTRTGTVKQAVESVLKHGKKNNGIAGNEPPIIHLPPLFNTKLDVEMAICSIKDNIPAPDLNQTMANHFLSKGIKVSGNFFYPGFLKAGYFNKITMGYTYLIADSLHIDKYARQICFVSCDEVTKPSTTTQGYFNTYRNYKIWVFDTRNGKNFFKKIDLIGSGIDKNYALQDAEKEFAKQLATINIQL